MVTLLIRESILEVTGYHNIPCQPRRGVVCDVFVLPSGALGVQCGLCMLVQLGAHGNTSGPRSGRKCGRLLASNREAAFLQPIPKANRRCFILEFSSLRRTRDSC